MGLFAKFKEELKKTKNNIVGQIDSMIKSFTKIDEELFEELEELLIMGDVGMATSQKICEKLREKVKKEVFAGLNSLQITNGASHAEFKITPDGKVKIIEIGARMGGDCIGSDLVKISTGYDFLKMVIDVALGNAPDFTKVVEPKKAVIKFIFTEADIEELEKVKKEHPEYIYYVSPIEKINSHKIVDSSTRYGYYILAI